MSTKTITGPVNIIGYTVYDDDVLADDAVFNIGAGSRLVLLGDDQLLNSTLAMQGVLRVRGPLEVDGLTIEDTAYLVNNATITQTGSVALGASADDVAVVRNLPGATWQATGSVTLSQTGANSRFVNLGLFAQGGADDTLTVGANFISRGAVQGDGTIDFQGATRLFGALSALTVNADATFLDGAAISTTGTFEAQSLIVRGDVTATSANVLTTLIASFLCADVHLQSGARLLFQGEKNVDLDNITGNGEIDFAGTSRLTADILTLAGDIKLVNAGVLSPFPGYVYDANAYVTITGAPRNGGQVEIDNLAGATWLDAITETTFDGDGTGNVFFHNSGTFEENGVAGATLGTTFNIDVINDGLFGADNSVGDGSTHNGFAFNNAVTGTGTVDVGLDSVTFNGSVGGEQTIAFTSTPSGSAAPTLTINDVRDFAATISGFDQNGATDDRIVVDTTNWTYQDFVANAAGAGGALMFADGAEQTSVSLTGAYNPAGFHATVSGSTTTIAYSAQP